MKLITAIVQDEDASRLVNQLMKAGIGVTKLATTGVRAGSTLTLAQALKNIVKFTDHPVEDVIPLMTVNPARAMRMDDRKGSIEVGRDADMVLLDDELNVAATIGLGRLLYQAE